MAGEEHLEAGLITRLNATLEGRYRIESELGEGGMATVYLAKDIKHEPKVALKDAKTTISRHHIIRGHAP